MSKFNKILNYFSSEVTKKKLANFQRIIEIFVKKLFKIWSWNRDPGAGTNPFRIPDPGVKKVSATLVDSDSFFYCASVGTTVEPRKELEYSLFLFLTGPDLEKNEGGGWTEGVDGGWLQIRNRTGSGFNRLSGSGPGKE